jgi:hypothetical protein
MSLFAVILWFFRSYIIIHVTYKFKQKRQFFLFLKLEQFCFPNNHTAGLVSSIFHLRIEKSTLALSLTLSS